MRRTLADTTVSVPPPVATALQQHPTSHLANSLSSSPRHHQTRPSVGNRDALARRQLWWLPYVVLEFDKNEVLVDAVGGDLANPVWMYSATFDVSRISEISVNAYLRTAPPKSGDASDMGNADLALGGIRFTPNLETNRLTDEWISIGPESGAIHVQVSFKPAQAPLTIDSFELLKVIGKGSFGKVSCRVRISS